MNDTPRTNRFYASFADGECIPNQDEWLALCESLETELTAVTEQRDVAIKCHEWCHEDRKRIIEELASTTAQRDRLLEQKEQWRLSSVCRELVEQRDEARRLAERYRYLSCDSQEEADETLLPWETTNPNEL
jgi:hypothetical protein